jgi:hypothetical protein
MSPRITIDLLEYEDHTLRIDGTVDACVGEQPDGLAVLLNEKEVPFRYTQRFADVVLREETLTNRRAFVLELPFEQLSQKSVIEFRGKTEAASDRIAKQAPDYDWAAKQMEVLPLITGGYQAKVCDALQYSYWCFASHMVTLRRGKTGTDGILICRAGRKARIAREAKLLREILGASYGSKKMFALRLLYWLARPFYRKKNIWITFDKLYKGGDCGEYFYKYMVSRRADGIRPVYVIRKDTADYRRLTAEGYHPSAYRSLRQRLSYLNAKMVFGTHSGVHSFCGFNNWEVQFIQDRICAVNTCIQHGLSVQNLQADSNRVINNNKRYYCASASEIRNLSGPEYDYDPSVLRLTGIPRYDGLVDRRQKQILITPTWRSYLAMPSVMGSVRPYNPDFKETEYYHLFQSLLENRELIETAKRTGYRIIYLLHPVISAQKRDFHPGEGIELVTALESNYEKLLTESSLMVTDYSGVQFDFAYMRKPVVYFHPPALPPHYGDGGFCYETQGFGEICRTPEELTAVLREYMERDCALLDVYRRREDDFFAFHDQESCRRIFEDAMDAQRRQ